MCGVAGIFNLDGRPVSRPSIERMTDALAHRGPDGAGIWIDGAIGLGHRRLAIRDLSERGRQPMTDRTGRITVTYNGEIYNDRALRQRLAGEAGEPFRSSCDSEFIGPSYRHWGLEAFDRFRGMFAIGLWDAERGELVLARDPVGIKPLYFAEVGRSIRFASEVKALLELPDQPFRLEAQALQTYLAQGYPGPERTLLSGIRPVPPGCMLVASRHGWRVERYWQPRRTGDLTDLDEALEGFAGLWQSVVRDHLVSDVPVGLLLSAGIDSSLIAAGLCGRDGVSAFTASFAREEFDEAPQAQAIAERLNVPHRTVAVDGEGDVAGRFLSVVHHYDGQCADSSGFAFHAVCEAAGRHAKVVLTGDGADEFFGGYETYRASRLAGGLRPILPPGLLRLGAGMLARAGRGGERRVSAGEKLFRWMSGIAAAPDCPHPQWRRYAFPHHLDLLAADALRDAVGGADPLSDYAGAVRGAPGGVVDRCLLADQRYYLPGDLLVKSDAMSMAHGIEIRVPFLDRRIMEFAGRLSADLLTPLRGPDKRFLRAALAREGLPSWVATKRKSGFNVPVAHLLRTGLRPLGQNLLDRNADLAAPFLRPDGVRRLWREHQERKANHGYVLWTLLTLAAWLSRESAKTDHVRSRAS